MNCRYCNTELKQGAKFCPNCGREVTEFGICISCGQQIKVGASFCPYCGANQNDVEEQVKQLEYEDSATSCIDSVEIEHCEETPNVDNAADKQHEETPAVDTHDDVANSFEPYEEESSSKKWIWAIVVLLIALIGGGYYYLSQNRGSSSGMAEAVDSDSIAVVDTIEVTDMKSLEKDLSAILSSVVSPSFEFEEMHKYFTEGYISFYKRACDKADKEGCEHPRIWWQESESDPESYKINSIDIKSEDEAVAKVTVSGETMKAVFDVVVKRENGKWLIDTVAQLQDVDDLSNEADVEEKKEFIRKMYKDFFENKNFDTQNPDNLRKYLSDKVINRIYLENPYDYAEGEKEYVVYFFYDGSLSVERPDVTIKKRQINSIDSDWFEVVGVDEYTGTPHKVQMEVRMSDKGYQVTDFKEK